VWLSRASGVAGGQQGLRCWRAAGPQVWLDRAEKGSHAAGSQVPCLYLGLKMIAYRLTYEGWERCAVRLLALVPEVVEGP